MNYYELFRYKKADNGSYSSIDLSNLDGRYNMMMNAIRDQKSLVGSNTADYAKLLEAEKELMTAYGVLSDTTKRAEYDASLKARRGAGVSKKVAAAVLVAVMASATLGGCSVDKSEAPTTTVTTPAPSYENGTEAELTFEEETPELTETEAETETEEETQEVTETEEENQEETQEETVETVEQSETVLVNDVEDDALVMEYATNKAAELAAANITNPVTNAKWTAEEIFNLIKFTNGVYKPASLEEIDLLYFDALNLFMSPLTSETGTEYYLYHIVMATGNHDFDQLIKETPHTDFGFADAFTSYKRNGTYPLMKWLEQKRFDMYNSLDKDEIISIYREIGQLYADIMKGNSVTITWEGVEYTYNSQEILGNMAASLLFTTEWQLIMANHYQIMKTDENGVEYIEDEVSQTWEVYNKLNSDGVDENGYPIIKPDIVTYDEIDAWLNNGCYTLDTQTESLAGTEIVTVIPDGQTFGQRVQGNIEGVAKNNYYMYVDGQSLSHGK